MRSRVLGLFALLLLVAGLSGCAGEGADEDAQDPAPTEEPKDDPLPDPLPDDVQGLAGEPPRVESLAADGRGGADGIVYDLATGQPLADATVFLTCAADATLLQGSPPIAVMPDAEGRFLVPAAPPFSECPEWTYSVEAIGYSMMVPLSHGPVVKTVWYSVYLGLSAE